MRFFDFWLIFIIPFSHTKKYPNSQIYAALTQVIDDKTEYLYDKYGRTGYLVNIGDYY
jgi:hypothetical protein